MQKITKIHIKPRNPNAVMTGANCEVWLDDQKVNGVTKLEFQVEAGGMAYIKMELIGSFELEGKTEAVLDSVSDPGATIK